MSDTRDRTEAARKEYEDHYLDESGSYVYADEYIIALTTRIAELEAALALRERMLRVAACDLCDGGCTTTEGDDGCRDQVLADLRARAMTKETE